MTDDQQVYEHEGQGRVAASIADQARAAAKGGDAEALKEALRTASPDERSAAAKALVHDRSAYDLLHATLKDLSIEPSG